VGTYRHPAARTIMSSPQLLTMAHLKYRANNMIWPGYQIATRI
jgi:hypothetical protein